MTVTGERDSLHGPPALIDTRSPVSDGVVPSTCLPINSLQPIRKRVRDELDSDYERG